MPPFPQKVSYSNSWCLFLIVLPVLMVNKACNALTKFCEKPWVWWSYFAAAMCQRYICMASQFGVIFKSMFLAHDGGIRSYHIIHLCAQGGGQRRRCATLLLGHHAAKSAPSIVDWLWKQGFAAWPILCLKRPCVPMFFVTSISRTCSQT